MVGVALLPSDSYASGMPIDSAALPDDVDALKRIVGEMARDAVAARAEIEKLRFQLARFRRGFIESEGIPDLGRASSLRHRA